MSAPQWTISGPTHSSVKEAGKRVRLENVKGTSLVSLTVPLEAMEYIAHSGGGDADQAGNLGK
jgi:hypothetical protein